MSFNPDYPGAITDFEVHVGGYGYNDAAGHDIVNTPKAIVLHTPEEPADNYESTPVWFANPASGQAGTHYYLDNDGDIYQMLPESKCPYANGNAGGVNRTWKGKVDQWPPWATPGLSLNCQTISIEMEGYAASIGQTWSDAMHVALIAWIRNVASRYGIPLDRDHIVGHYELATDRTDPGAGFPWERLMADLTTAPTPSPEPKVGDKPIAFSAEQHAALEASVFRRVAIVPDKFIRTGVDLKTADGSMLPAGSMAAGYRIYIEHAERP